MAGRCGDDDDTSIDGAPFHCHPSHRILPSNHTRHFSPSPSSSLAPAPTPLTSRYISAPVRSVNNLHLHFSISRSSIRDLHFPHTPTDTQLSTTHQPANPPCPPSSRSRSASGGRTRRARMCRRRVNRECVGCGAELTIDVESARRGVLVCPHPLHAPLLSLVLRRYPHPTSHALMASLCFVALACSLRSHAPADPRRPPILHRLHETRPRMRVRRAR